MRRAPTPTWRPAARGFAVAALWLLTTPAAAQAGRVEYQFSGTIANALGPISAGTPFTGLFTYDFPQAAAPTTFFGGTQSVFTFNSLTLTIGGQTVSEGPGQLGLYNDVNPPNGVPVGDSLYTFVPGIPNNSPNPSTGSFTGLQPNFIYLGFVDSTGKAFSGPGLPQALSLSAFTEAFVGVNYGPLGTGNTTTINPIASLTPTGVPEPSTVVLLAAGTIGVIGSLRGRRRR